MGSLVYTNRIQLITCILSSGLRRTLHSLVIAYFGECMYVYVWRLFIDLWLVI